MEFNKLFGSICRICNGILVGQAPARGSIYIIPVSPFIPQIENAAAAKVVPFRMLRDLFGLLNYRDLRLLVKSNLLSGIKVVDDVSDPFCEPCVMGNFTNLLSMILFLAPLTLECLSIRTSAPLLISLSPRRRFG